MSNPLAHPTIPSASNLAHSWRVVLILFLLLILSALPELPGASGAEVDESKKHAFDWTVGNWEGVRRDGEDGTETPMIMRVESILGGAGQIRHLQVGEGEKSYLGFAVQVFDAKRGLWHRRYTNSTRGTFSSYEGECKGLVSVWDSTTPDRTREMQIVSERVEPPGWRRTMSVSEDDGKTWKVLWVDELIRTENRSP